MDRSSRQNQQGNIGLKGHIRIDGLNRYVQSTPSTNSRIQIIFKGT